MNSKTKKTAAAKRPVRRSKKILAAASCLAVASAAVAGDHFSRFAGLEDFSKFSKSRNDNGEIVLLSPVIAAPIDWNQLVVSWNAKTPAGTYVAVEAKAVFPTHESKFYSLGKWSRDEGVSRSDDHQRDEDGRVATDTLVTDHPAKATQIRLTVGGKNPKAVDLKFLGLSFCNTTVEAESLPANRAAWGKIVATPELSQNSYPQEQGWCSATSMSMVLQRWSGVLNRPEMKLDVPEVAAGVLDSAYGTGNWPFNTAFAGSFDGMRAYVSRFSGISELEDWIAAGIPVIISAPYHLLQPGRRDTGNGHVVVCVGFTETGDVYINDPATNLKKNSVRHLYKRSDVIRAWGASHNTVYLVYPISAKLPANRLGQW